jgi:hypothetical protein
VVAGTAVEEAVLAADITMDERSVTASLTSARQLRPAHICAPRQHRGKIRSPRRAQHRAKVSRSLDRIVTAQRSFSGAPYRADEQPGRPSAIASALNASHLGSHDYAAPDGSGPIRTIGRMAGDRTRSSVARDLEAVGAARAA